MGYFSCFTWSSSAIFGWYESRSNVHIYYRNTFCLFKKSLAFFFQFLIISIPVFGAYGLLELGSRREVCLMVSWAWQQKGSVSNGVICVCDLQHWPPERQGREPMFCQHAGLGPEGEHTDRGGQNQLHLLRLLEGLYCFFLSVATSLCCFSPLCSHQVVLFLISL